MIIFMSFTTTAASKGNYGHNLQNEDLSSSNNSKGLLPPRDSILL